MKFTKSEIETEYWCCYTQFVDRYTDKNNLRRGAVVDVEEFDKLPDYFVDKIRYTVMQNDESIREQIMKQANAIVDKAIIIRNIASSPYLINGYAAMRALVDTRGRVQAEKKIKSWYVALEVYDLYQKQEIKNKSEVSRNMKWFNSATSADCVKEITKYLNLAERLIDSIGNGTFAEEAKKPFRKY